MVEENPYAKFVKPKPEGNPYARFAQPAIKSAPAKSAAYDEDAPSAPVGKRTWGQLGSDLTPRIADLPGEVAKDYLGGIERIKRGGSQVAYGSGKDRYLYGPGNLALGAAGAVFSPLDAAIHTALGAPAARGTGSPLVGAGVDIAASLLVPGPKTKAVRAAQEAGVVGRSTLGSTAYQATANAPGIKPAFAEAKKILAPETIDEHAGRTASNVIEEQGLRARETAGTEAILKPFDNLRAGMMDEHKIELIDAIQTGKPVDPRHKNYSEALTGVLKDSETRLKALPKGAQMRFKELYFPMKWVEGPGGVPIPKWMGSGGGKEGNTGFLEHQNIGLKEGIALGAKPRTLDPTEAVLHYKINVDKFIAAEKTVEKMKDQGLLKYFFAGSKNIPENWVKVEGRLGRDPRGDGVAQAYAPESVARIYNNFIDTGLSGQPAYEAARKLNSSMLAFKLGISGYHATMETLYEAPMSMMALGQSELATASQHVRAGEIGAAGRAAFKGAQHVLTAPLAPIQFTRKGSKLIDAYKGMHPGADREADLMAELYAKGGGRTGREGATGEYEFAKRGRYTMANVHSALNAFKIAPKKMFNALTSPNTMATALHKGGETAWHEGRVLVGAQKTALGLLNHINRSMQTIAAPLFEYYIPRLKAGAFSEQMSAWLKANPLASEVDRVLSAQKIVASVENRFGEMTRDNLFMSKTLQQSLQLLTVSYSYELGTVRELGAGALDLVKGKSFGMKSPNWSPRSNYLTVLPLYTAFIGAMYQYMKVTDPKTGKGQLPESLMDLIAPRTGGIDTNGQPERMSPIGHAKDVYTLLRDGPVAWASGKGGPMVSAAKELATGSNIQGFPTIPTPKKGEPGYGEPPPPWWQRVLPIIVKSYTPITADSFEKRGPKSNISGVEAAFGSRPAGKRYTMPNLDYKTIAIPYDRNTGKTLSVQKKPKKPTSAGSGGVW